MANKKTRFEIYLEKLELKHKHTRSYSLWQNDIVERNRGTDNKLCTRGSALKDIKKC